MECILGAITSDEENESAAPKKRTEYQIGDVKVSPDTTVYRIKLNNADGSRDQSS
jgi:hypothetical protein